MKNSLHPASTLERPADRLLKTFTVAQVGNDTVRTDLQRGFSLAICCRDCPRLIEWTPPDLQERFGGRLDLRIADLAKRLSCTGDGGCGAKDVAVFLTSTTSHGAGRHRRRAKPAPNISASVRAHLSLGAGRLCVS